MISHAFFKKLATFPCVPCTLFVFCLSLGNREERMSAEEDINDEDGPPAIISERVQVNFFIFQDEKLLT